MMPLWNHLICFQATAAAGIPSPSVVCCMYTRSTPSSVTYGCLIHDEPVQGAKTHCPQNLFTDLQSDSLASKPIFIIKKKPPKPKPPPMKLSRKFNCTASTRQIINLSRFYEQLKYLFLRNKTVFTFISLFMQSSKLS